MNYIWYPIIKAMERGYDVAKIHYRVKDREFYYNAWDKHFIYNAEEHRVSPLFEYMPVVLYDPADAVDFAAKYSCVDINPYHRFGHIFSRILRPDRNDPNDLIICDIMLHILAYVDRICGMSKRDFQIMLIIAEIEQGCYGNNDGAFALFNTKEKRAVAESLIMLHEIENGLRSLDALLKKILTDFKMWVRDETELVLYNPYPLDEQDDKKLRFILKLFLPIGLPYVVHWQYTYGIIGQDDRMVLEAFVPA